jgi:hypothetical protein
MKRLIVVCVGCLFIPALLHAQGLPCNTYGGQQDERACALSEATNSGWVLAGWTTSFGPATPAFKNLLIVRTDAAGIPIGAKVSVGEYDEEIRGMARTADGGHVLCGWTKSQSIGAPPNANILVIKLDSLFNVQWAWVYGDTLGDEYAYSVVADPLGNGCTVSGFTSSWGPPPYPNILVMKLNQAGIVQWTRVYWNVRRPLLEEAYGLTRMPPGPTRLSYVVVGRWAEPGLDTLWDGFVMRLDSEGIPVQPGPVRVIPGAFDEEAYSVTPTFLEPQSYAVAGWTNSWGPGAPPHANIFLIKFSEMGTPVSWRRVYGWSEDDEQLMDDRSLIATTDKGYALCGWTDSRGPGAPPNSNFLILKLDSLGQPLWTRIHPSQPGAQDERAYPMIRDAQGRYAIAGYTNSFGAGGDDFHFLTLNQFGDRPVCIDSPPIEVDTIPVYADTIVAYPVSPEMAPLMIVDTSVLVTEVCPLVGIKDEPRRSESPSGARILAGPAPQIQLFVPVASHNTLRLLDATGRQLALLAQGWYGVGRYTFSIPVQLAPGVYYLDVVTRGRRASMKVIRM